MIDTTLDSFAWVSGTVLAAELDTDGLVVRANQALERLAGRALVGERLDGVVSPPQREAFASRLAAAGESWAGATFAFTGEPGRQASDRTVWLRRVGDGVQVVAEPAVDEQSRLVEKVLELNDDLVTAQRELIRERERLQTGRARIASLEAIAAAGLMHTRLDAVLDEVLRAIAAAVRAPRAVVLLLDGSRSELVSGATYGLEALIDGPIRVPVGTGVAGGVAASGEPRVIEDLRRVDVHSAYLRESSRSMAAVPLVLDGEIIGVLHASADEPGQFAAEDLGLLVAAAERAAVAISRAQAHERERNIAETLQRALLPDRLPAVDGLLLTARFVPGTDVAVGGDWYDAVPLESGELAVVIGDVAGKGVRAASLMGEARTGLRAYLLDGGSPDAVLARTDRLLRRARHMATALLVLVSPATGELRFASAGHLPPLRLDRDGRAVEFLDGGRSTPLLAYRSVEPAVARLEPGDRLLLYTDGLVERRGEAIDDSLQRLADAARGLQGDLDAVVDALVARMQPPHAAARDDVAVMALERV